MSELTRWCYKQRAVLFIFISIFASYRERFGRVKAVVRESNWTNQTRGGDNNIKRKDWSRKSYGICEKSLWKSGNFIGAPYVQVWIFKERCHEIYQRSLEVGTPPDWVKHKNNCSLNMKRSYQQHSKYKKKHRWKRIEIFFWKPRLAYQYFKVNFWWLADITVWNKAVILPYTSNFSSSIANHRRVVGILNKMNQPTVTQPLYWIGRC